MATGDFAKLVVAGTVFVLLPPPLPELDEAAVVFTVMDSEDPLPLQSLAIEVLVKELSI